MFPHGHVDSSPSKTSLSLGDIHNPVWLIKILTFLTLPVHRENDSRDDLVHYNELV
jgi:hypothetical protein